MNFDSKSSSIYNHAQTLTQVATCVMFYCVEIDMFKKKREPQLYFESIERTCDIVMQPFNRSAKCQQTGSECNPNLPWN